MLMREILHDFKEYDVVYNAYQKIIVVNKPIDVKRFVVLKMMLQSAKEEIRDITVEI